MRNSLILTAAALLLASCARGSNAPEPAAVAMTAMPGMVHRAAPTPEVLLPPAGQLMANVRTAPAVVKPLAKSIAAAGRVAYDEARLERATAWVAGRVERLHVATTGSYVRKGAPLLAIYSPDLLAGQREYLLALDTAHQLRSSRYSDIAAGAGDMVEAARSRLRQWGLTAAQLDALARTRSPQTTVTIVSPASGTVMRKLVQPGQYVGTGDVLFELADLSRVWIEADVPEADLGQVRPGQAMTATAIAYPGETFSGTISFVYPTLDEATRTGRVRAAFANTAGRLKPGMYVQARLASSLGRRLTVPASAVLQTGGQPVVWVELASGQFRRRRITLGPRAGDDFVVQGGLKAGERVASAGGFLIDSEAQLAAAQGGPPPATAGPAGRTVVEAGGVKVALQFPAGGPRIGKNTGELAFSRGGRPVAVEGVAASIVMYMPGMPMKADAMVEPGGAAGHYKVMFASPMQGTWTLAVNFKSQGRAATARFALGVR